jgi:hypothetical protein
LYQLNDKKLLSNFFFSFDFKQNSLILGENINENDPEYYKKNIDNYPNKENWEISFNEIYYNDTENKKISDDISSSIFTPSYNGIIGSKFYKEYFISNFSNLQSCYEEHFNYFNVKLIGYYCDSNTKIEKLKTIYFRCKDLNYTFELDYKDLFEKYDNKYYFNIYFINEDKNNKNSFLLSTSFWYLGNTFFNKYKIIFNQDKKTIGISHKNPLNKEYNNVNFFYKFLCVVLFIIIVFLCYLLYKFYLQKPRRVKANELNEKFDYEPNSNSINSDYTRIDENNNNKSKLIS